MGGVLTDLTNILRHAGSPTAEIRVTQQETCLQVESEDAGKGISPENEPVLELSTNTGVGLRGMRDRLRPLGGLCTSTQPGTERG